MTGSVLTSCFVFLLPSVVVLCPISNEIKSNYIYIIEFQYVIKKHKIFSKK